MDAEKDALRRDALRRRNALSGEDRSRWSKVIAGYLSAMPEYRRAQTIGIYRAIGSEVELDSLFVDAEAADARRVFYPRCGEARSLAFVEVSPRTRWRRGVFGILEPEGPSIPIRRLDLVVVPVVAFDRVGHRIGYGAGYYDRALAAFDGVATGVAFEAQRVPVVPFIDTDVPLATVVTEKGVMSFCESDRRGLAPRQPPCGH
ncbi:MAG: 5-formyltetrahydrofolate cyclo-ligase [Myxococcota bacterium]